MKLLVITDSYPPNHSGGYELRCKDVIDALFQRGHQVRIISTRICSHDGDIHQEEKNIFRVLHAEENSSPLLKRIYTDYQDLRFLNKLIGSYEPDIIYLWHVINFTRAIFPYLAELNIPIVYDEGGNGLAWAWQHHGPWYTMIDRKSNSPVKNGVKWILSRIVNLLSGNLIMKEWQWPNINAYFTSELNFKNVQKLNIQLENAQVIHSGIDITKFPYISCENASIPIDIITPGRITPQKGIKDSIFLVKSLIMNNIPARLKIVGKIDSQPHFDELEQELVAAGLEDNVNFLPLVDHQGMASLYQESDICFFPSYYKQGFSRVPIEAMACGSLVITYGNEGSDEIISNNKTGLIVQEGNIDEAVSRIIELLIQPDQIKKIRINARLDIEKNYTLDHYIEMIEAFLFESLAKE